MGLGFFEYNNSNTIPYGMNGSSFNFRYRLYKHNLKTGHDFRYDVYFDYSGLGNPYIIDKDLVLFNYFGFNTGAGWMRPIINGIEGLGVNVGFGVITSYSIHYTKLYDSSQNPKRIVRLIILNYNS